MGFLFTLLSQKPYLSLPVGLPGSLLALAIWLVLLILVIGLARRWRAFEKPRTRRYWLTAAVLAVFTPPTSLFFGLLLNTGGSLPPPGVPVEQLGAAMMLLSAVPWVLAGGLLGPWAAAGLAAVSGLLLAVWETHNPFLPLELALLAVLISALVHQRYRTPTYQLLRQPVVAAAFVGLASPFLSALSTGLMAEGQLAARLDYVFSLLLNSALAQGGELLLAGLFAQVAAMGWPLIWGSREALQPSPTEKSLRERMLYWATPLFAVLLFTLVVADWYTAGSAARQILSDRMIDAARNVSQGVPYFLDVGQNQIALLTMDARLLSGSSEEKQRILQEARLRTAFFNQLYLLDRSGSPVTGFPQEIYDQTKQLPDELIGIQYALRGVPPIQTFTAAPLEGSRTAQASFVATIFDGQGQPQGVLVGRADLETNPFSRPILNNLQSMAAIEGEGLLLDEKGRILYHSDRNLLLSEYSGPLSDETANISGATGEELIVDQVAPDGTRRLMYVQQAQGRPWKVVLAVPARQVQQIALDIALPLFIMLLVVALFGYILLRLGLNMVAGSLRGLAVQAGRLAQGQLSESIAPGGEDEVGQLRRSLEHMRASLKARLDELNRLLVVSQGVASSLELDVAVRAVLESAVGMGANTARIVVVPAVVPELEGDALKPQVFSYGGGVPPSELYADLDEQILALARTQDRLVLSNVARPRLLHFAPGATRPAALIAAALRHESQFYGCLWVAYDQPHNFSEEEVRFFMTLAGQAALAAANAHLFLTAEIGRQRLAAILASTPDPVLVTDQRNRLLLANPAAWRVFGLSALEWEEGQPIQKVLNQPALLELMLAGEDEKRASEIQLDDERVFYVTVSSVQAEGQRVGRVCVLRDITYFKELDALKSEFVATVSHDLRSPLTLMRGYATMLEMVGELNEQQTGYVRKIIASVEGMARLVNNLLDLGRIEAGIGLQLEMVSVYDIVERVVGALQLQATQKRITLNAEIPEQTIPLLEADPALLQQALQNLVDNAIKYTDSGGKVQVRVNASQNRMLFMVSDTGIGISPVDQPRLFEKFYRGAQHSSKQRPGMGLGLAIVRSIAERHGGKAWVESQLGKGSTFFLAIPLRQAVSEIA